MTSDTLYIVMPAYNEADNIADIVESWHPIVSTLNKRKDDNTSRLVIFNDGSTDTTLEILNSLKGNYPDLDIIDKPNSGHGATLIDAYKYALDNGASYVFQTDSDGQTNPDEFWQFWELRNAYDMIIGSRTKRQDGVSRVVVAKVLRTVIRHSFKVDCEDANAPFRLMSAQTLQRNLSLIPDGFNLSNVLLAVIYTKSSQRIKYIPITFKPRQGGVNSINLKSIFQIGHQAIKDFKILNETSLNNLDI